MKKKLTVGGVVRDWALVIVAVVLIIVFSIWNPSFLSLVNLRNILVQNAYVAILSMGTTLIMISGAVDLSQGYMVSTIAVVMTMLMTQQSVSVPVALLIGVGIGLLCSVANIALSLYLKAHPMIITLATMAILEGISYTISGSRSFIKLPKAYLFIGQGSIGVIPVNVIIMVVVVIITMVLLGRTYIGKRIYACGDNPEAARLAGIKVTRIKIGVFAFAGVLAAVSAIVLSARNGSANSSTGVGLEFTTITACVLGGVALQGGEGRPWKVLVAVYVLGILATGMQFIGLGTYPQYIVKGCLMLFSVGLSNNIFQLRRKNKVETITETEIENKEE